MSPPVAGPLAGVDLRTTVGQVLLPNPVMTASGTAGYGAELAAYLDLSALGAVVVKSLSNQPWDGNPSPRVHPLPVGMLNSVGLHNGGVGAWLTAELPPLAATGARVVASIWGFTVDDYAAAAGTLADAHRQGRVAPVVAVEVNVSCPNLEDRRHMFAHSPASTGRAVAATVEALAGTGIPAWAKLSPNVTDLTEIAGAALDHGAAALTLVNTVMGLALDPLTGRPRLGAGGGGLSGPAIHTVAVRAVYDVRRAFPGAPIVGVGGITSGTDAAELLAAGADAIQVGTATFADPRAPIQVLGQLAAWCRRHGVRATSDLVGRAHAPGDL